MKQYINNRSWNNRFENLGDKFNFGFKLGYDFPPLVTDQPYCCVPLFAPVMFENLYSDVTEKLFPTFDALVGTNTGLTGYTKDIWGTEKIDAGLNTTSLYPYSANNKFGYAMGVGNSSGAPLNTTNFIWFQSISIDYINFLNYLKTEQVYCSNINIQILQKGTGTIWNRAPIYFFQQEIDGTIKSIQTTPIDWVNPVTNLNTQPSAGNSNINFDIPCDYIFHKSSGLALGYSNEVKQTEGYYSLNFTLQQILK